MIHLVAALIAYFAFYQITLVLVIIIVISCWLWTAAGRLLQGCSWHWAV